MDAAAESPPVEPVESAPGFFARNIRWVKLAAVGLVVLILLSITAALFLGGGKEKPAGTKSRPSPVSEAAGAAPAATSAPAQAPTPEEVQAAAREAEKQRLAVQEAHDRVMSGEASAGGALSAPVSIRPTLGKSVPVVAASAPEPTIAERKPAEPKSTAPQPVAKAESVPPVGPAPPVSSAMPTPLGRQGYGVNQSNVEGLTTLIEAMNKADAAKNKPRK